MQVTTGRCGTVDFTCSAPPSKSYTHRALIIAALADGESVIFGQLDADDTRMTARALMQLGIRIDWEEKCIRVRGCGGRLTAPADPISIADSGTSMRLLTAVSLLADGPVILTGSRRMQERPLGPLVETLNRAGTDIGYLQTPGCPPVRISGSLPGGEISIEGSISSQFISSLLIAAPYAAQDSRITITGDLVSLPYIMMTIGIMEQSGAVVRIKKEPGKNLVLEVSSRDRYVPGTYTVE
ncbi:MAG: 3-phosphoshikimate 1-carboxyvinyltransferase, partial [Methanospirillum sp.]|nr:3-phosphoshikimate 1-carboxyvinyltransferase [Methanospirillum sp.]